MFRTIKPENGYCFYFPNRPKGKRFEAGRSIRVWWGEEWKHIKLGQFGVQLPDSNAPELITTAENLECNVRADFKIVVGGSGEVEDIESRLEKATRTCPPTRRVNEKIELIFFQNWVVNYCRNSIKRIISESKFVSLIEDADYKSDVAKRIRDDLAKNLDNIGMILVESTLVIEPLEPKGVLATKEILDKWLDVHKTLDKATVAKEQAIKKQEEELKELQRVHSIRIMEIEQQEKLKKKESESEIKNKMLEIDRDDEIKQELRIRDKENELREIKEQLAAINQAMQLQKIRSEAELIEERERKRQEMEKLKQQFDAQVLHNKMDLLELEKQAQERQMALMESKEKISKLESELARIEGTIKAELAEKEVLAKSADLIQMRKSLMDALPKILEQANRPIEKMGEIRILNFSGGSEKQDHSSLVGSLISSASLLPMIKEVTRFLSDLDKTDQPLQNVEKKKQKPTIASTNDHVKLEDELVK